MDGTTSQRRAVGADGQPPLAADNDGCSWGAAQIEDLQTRLSSAEQKIANLEHALESSRVIGAAIGVLMNQRQITYDAGFELLRVASQSEHRKLRDVAAEVVYTGALDPPADRSA